MLLCGQSVDHSYFACGLGARARRDLGCCTGKFAMVHKRWPCLKLPFAQRAEVAKSGWSGATGRMNLKASATPCPTWPFMNAPIAGNGCTTATPCARSKRTPPPTPNPTPRAEAVAQRAITPGQAGGVLPGRSRNGRRMDLLRGGPSTRKAVSSMARENGHGAEVKEAWEIQTLVVACVCSLG